MSYSPRSKTHLILVRHGQIQANIDKRWHGWTDSPLTEHGRQQALLASRRLAQEHRDISAIYASPLQRTHHTAQAIADALNKPVALADGLKEYGIGEWEGESFGDLHQKHGFFDKIRDNPNYAPVGGESLTQVTNRITQALRELAAQHGGEKILAVSHGGVMALALAAMLDRDPYAWGNYYFTNTSVSEVLLDIEQDELRAELVRFNCVKHLD